MELLRKLYIYKFPNLAKKDKQSPKAVALDQKRFGAGDKAEDDNKKKE
jgi:hypothetical protein